MAEHKQMRSRAKGGEELGGSVEPDFIFLAMGQEVRFEDGV